MRFWELISVRPTWIQFKFQSSEFDLEKLDLEKLIE